MRHPGSILGIMAKNPAVGIKNLGFADEANILAMFNDRQIPGAGVVKLLHYLLHGLADLDLSRRRTHKLHDMHPPVEVRAEHNIAYIVEQDDSKKFPVMVYDRKQIAVGACDHLDHLLKAHIGTHCLEISLYHIVDLKQGKHSLVLVVGQQFAALSQTHGVDTVREEQLYGPV